MAINWDEIEAKAKRLDEKNTAKRGTSTAPSATARATATVMPVMPQLTLSDKLNVQSRLPQTSTPPMQTLSGMSQTKAQPMTPLMAKLSAPVKTPENTDPNILERIAGTVGGATKTFAGGLVNAVDVASQSPMLNPGLWALRKYNDLFLPNATGKAADYLMESGAKSTERAKEGASGAGKLAIDVGTGALQMAGDIGLGVLTGGGAMLPMAARSFGGAAYEAEQAGASLTGQYAYGGLTAGTSMLVEKLSNAGKILNKAFGKGIADDVLENGLNKAIGKLVKNEAVTGRLSAALAAGVGEGVEEMIESTLSPLYQKLTYNPDAKYDADTVSDILYDGLVGAIIGGAAGGVGGGNVQPQTQDVAKNLNATAKLAQDIAQQRTQAPTIEQNDLTSKLPIQNQNATQGVVEPVVDNKPMEMPREQTGPHIDERVYSDVSSRKVNAFQFDNPELHEHYAVAANGLQNDLRMATKGERFGVKDSDGYYVDSIGIKRSVSPEIEVLLDNAKLSYAQIEKGLADLIADHGQENYAAAKKIELVLDDMLTNGYEVEGYQIEPDYEYIQKKEAIKSGEHSNEYAMTEDEWNALLKSEPATSPAQPAIFPESSLGAKIVQRLPEGTGAASLGFDPYTNMQNQFGNIPVGENPARVVDVPAKTSRDTKVSHGIRTAMEAQATPGSTFVQEQLQQAVVNGRFSYIPVTDKSAVGWADKTIKSKGWEKARVDWTADARGGKVSKDLIVLGQTLYNNAVNAGNVDGAVDVLVDLVRMSRSGAQATQANRVLKTLSPQYQLYALQRSVERLNSEIQEKQKSKKAKNRNISDADNVPVEQWMERTGELLAKKLDKRVNGKVKAKTTAQTILADLTRFANQTVESNKKQVDARSELDRITDLFNNREHYMEAWDKAKSTIAEQYADNPDALAAFDDWFADTLDYTSKLTKELTGQSEIKIDKVLAEEYLSAQTDEDSEDVLEKIKDDVASQVPASWMDKWNAWRYLSMLGNPRTHVRNIVGNAGFTPVRMIKNVIATGVEKASGKGQTKSVLTLKDKPLIQYALSDYDGVSEQIMSLGKLDNFTGDINSRRRIFKSKAIEGARKFNAKALDVEDVWFAKPAYANALAGWYKANGITAAALKNGMVSQEKIDSGRAYAIREAQRATYRDANQFSDWVAKLGSGYTGDNKIAKTANVLVEGVLPFKRTPANILARAFEYSPAGLIKGLTNDLVQVKNGNMEAWQAIDNISAGLTGTGLLGLGTWLASMGLLSGAGGDDEDKALNNLTGAQNWSLNIGDKSITLDWLAPEALPLFVGVELWNAAMDKGEDGLSIMTFLDKLSNITEPMFEMSMLQGMNDLLGSIKYSDNNNLVGIATTAAVNYLSQGLPTLLGQIERSFEPVRKTTYTNSEKDLPTSTQRMLGKISGKIPFWEYQQTEYRDAFGRTESSGTAAERIINNFLNPAYTKDLTNDKVTDELRRLSDGNYLESAPDAPAKSFKYGGEPHVLSADEYSKFQKTAGEKTHSLLDGLIGSSEYKKLNDEKKSKLVEQIMSYSTDTAKREYIGEDYKSGNYEKVYEAEQAGIEPSKYFMYKDALEDIRPEGGTPAQYQYSKAIDALDLSTQYKSKLWEIQNGGESDKNPFTGILAQKGMAPEDCIKIMEEYNKLDKSMDGYTKAEDGPGKSQVQAAYFMQWLESAGYTKAQADYIADVFKTWQMIPIEKPSKKALAYVEANPR